MIEFHRVVDQIRWRINLTALKKAGFKVDRRLLQSATEVVEFNHALDNQTNSVGLIKPMPSYP